MSEEPETRDAKEIDRDLGLIKNHRDNAVKKEIALDNTQFTHPLVTASAPSIVMSFIIQAGYALPTNYFIAIVAISAIAAALQHLNYASQKQDETNRIIELDQTERDILDGAVLNPSFASIINAEVDAKSSLWSRVSPAKVFKVASAAVATTAMFGMGLNADQNTELNSPNDISATNNQSGTRKNYRK